MNSRSIQLPKGKIHYKASDLNPDKETIVFLHGFLGSHEIWSEFIPEFSSHYNVIAIDLPGHGDSTYLDEVLTMSDMASAVLAVLNTENVEAAHFVGHSMGGYVTLALTKLKEDKVRSITLFNSSLYPDSEENKRNRKAAVRLLDLKPSILINEIIQNLFRAESIENFNNEFEKIKRIALNTQVKAVQASLLGMSEREDFQPWSLSAEIPIQLFAGIYDNAVPFELSKQQTQESPVKLVVFDETAHMGFIEEKIATQKALKTFFKEIKATL